MYFYFNTIATKIAEWKHETIDKKVILYQKVHKLNGRCFILITKKGISLLYL